MDNHISVINNDPAIAGESLLFSLFIMFGADVFNGGFGERIQHAVAGAGTNDEVVGKRYDILQIDQDNIFAFFIFKGVYDFTCKFQCVQISPHGLDNGAENNFVYTDPPDCKSLLKRCTESTLAVAILPS